MITGQLRGGRPLAGYTRKIFAGPCPRAGGQIIVCRAWPVVPCCGC